MTKIMAIVFAIVSSIAYNSIAQTNIAPPDLSGLYEYNDNLWEIRTTGKETTVTKFESTRTLVYKGKLKFQKDSPDSFTFHGKAKSYKYSSENGQDYNITENELNMDGMIKPAGDAKIIFLRECGLSITTISEQTGEKKSGVIECSGIWRGLDNDAKKTEL